MGFAASARFLLLISLIGAFVLAIKATDTQSIVSLGVLIAYCLLVIFPVAYLEIRKRA